MCVMINMEICAGFRVFECAFFIREQYSNPGTQTRPTTVIQSDEQHHVIVGFDIPKIEHIVQDRRLVRLVADIHTSA